MTHTRIRISPSSTLKNSFFIPSNDLIHSLSIVRKYSHGYIFRIQSREALENLESLQMLQQSQSMQSLLGLHTFQGGLGHIYVIWYASMGTMNTNVLTDKLMMNLQDACDYEGNAREYYIELIYGGDMNLDHLERSGRHSMERSNALDDASHGHESSSHIPNAQTNAMYRSHTQANTIDDHHGAHGAHVTVQGKYNLIWNIESVNVKPLSDDDFEILDLHKDEFATQMLNQHRVLSLGLIFPFWVTDDVVIYMKVVGSTIEQYNDINSVYILGRGTYFNIEKPPAKVTKSHVFFEKKVLSSQDVIRSIKRNINNHPRERSGQNEVNINVDCVSYSKYLSDLFAVRNVLLNQKWAKEHGIDNGDVIELIHTLRYVAQPQNLAPNAPAISKLQKCQKVTFGVACLTSDVSESQIALPSYLMQEIACHSHSCIYVRVSDLTRKQTIFTIYMYKLAASPHSKLESLKYLTPSQLKERLSEYVSRTFRKDGIPFVSKGVIEFLKDERYLISFNSPIHVNANDIQVSLFSDFSNPEVPLFANLLFLTKEIVDKVDIVLKDDILTLPSSSDANIEKITSTLEKYHTSFKELKEQISNQLEQDCHGTSIVSYTLINGSPGSGKSTTVKALCHNISAYVVCISCNKLVGERADYIMTVLRGKVADAQFHSPSLLILEDFDLLCPMEQEDAMVDMNVRLTTSVLLDLLTQISQKNKGHNIACLFTAQSKEYLHKFIQDAELIEKELQLSNPSMELRRQIISDMWNFRYPELKVSESFLQHMNHKTEGFSVQDLKNIIEQTVSRHMINSMLRTETLSKEIVQSDFDEVFSTFQKQAEEGIKLVKVNATWEDVGGLESVVRVMRETFEFPSKYPEIFSKAPLKLPSGILLYGPTGCGKTHLAQVAAGACGLNFISVKGPEILNKYIGQSEENVRKLFRQAESAKPCIIFFDEFDSIAAPRGKDTTGVTDRVVNQFLCQMDGVESRDGVYVLAATSRPDLIDAALLRPGRLDKSLYCGFPDVKEREQILQVLSRQVKLHEDVDLNEFASMTNHYTGADLQGLITNASIIAAHSFDEEPPTKSNSSIPAHHQSFLDSLRYDAGNPPPSDVTTQLIENLSLKLKDHHQGQSPNVSKQGGQDESTLQNQNTGLYITRNHLLMALKESSPSVGKKERLRLQRIYEMFQENKKQSRTMKPYIPSEAHVTLA